MTKDIATPPASRRPRRMAREPQPIAAEPAQPKRQSKTSQVLAMLQRPEGATLEQLIVATSWLPHTTRAALTGLKKKGQAITSSKVSGEMRTYRIAPASGEA